MARVHSISKSRTEEPGPSDVGEPTPFGEQTQNEDVEAQMLEQLQVDLDYEFFAIETAEAFSIVLSVYIFPSP